MQRIPSKRRNRRGTGRCAAVEWICGVALQTPFPVGSFDLVSMQYPALSKAAGDAAVRGLLDTVRPGGLMLAVYHDLDNERRERMKSRGVDPADYVGCGALLSPGSPGRCRRSRPGCAQVAAAGTPTGPSGKARHGSVPQ